MHNVSPCLCLCARFLGMQGNVIFEYAVVEVKLAKLSECRCFLCVRGSWSWCLESEGTRAVVCVCVCTHGHEREGTFGI